jgi:hypothetical protein
LGQAFFVAFFQLLAVSSEILHFREGGPSMSLASDYLLVRGITPQTTTRNQLEFDIAPLDQKRIVSRLNPGCVQLWSLAKELLWFPVRNNVMAPSWIARPFPTLINGPKFVVPKGGIAPPFVPVGVPALAHGQPLIVTEGPVKALAATQAGVAAIGLNGGLVRECSSFRRQAYLATGN